MAWHGLSGTRSAGFIYFCKDGEADFPEGKTTTSAAPLGYPATHHWLSNRATIDQMIDWLRRKRPAHLTVYPSIAAGIARRWGKDAAELGIRAVLTYGEALICEDKLTIEETLSVPVVDAYSANEVGFIALQCPKSSTYHVRTDTILVEVVDRHGRPVPDGEVGEIIVTPFYNTVMPLIRYRIGDLGAFARDQCGCGIRLPRLQTIHGRARQLFTYSDGSQRFANLHLAALQSCVPLEQYQIIQHTTTRVELIYVPRDGGGPPDMDALQALAQRDLAPDVVIEATPVPEIPRSATGKYERTISHI
jgi:phenylacetate-CoA ligase